MQNMNKRGWAILLTLVSTSLGFSQSPISYQISGMVGRVLRTSPTPAAAINSYFQIDLTITNFTSTVPQYGTYGDFALASVRVTAPAFGISNAPVVNRNFELFFFDNGTHEQLALKRIIGSSQSSQTYDTILLDSYGLDFIDNPRVPTPLKRNLVGVSMEIGGSWASAFQLGNGTTLGLWYGDFDATVKNLAVVPEPAVGALLLLTGMGLAIRRGTCRSLETPPVAQRRNGESHAARQGNARTVPHRCGAKKNRRRQHQGGSPHF
jgi:hypothetical protein